MLDGMLDGSFFRSVAQPLKTKLTLNICKKLDSKIMENKSTPLGIYLLSGGLLLLGIIYLLYGVIGRVSFAGEVSTMKRAYLIITGAASALLAYGVYKRKEIARKFAILISMALSVMGPIKSLGYMLYVGDCDSAKIVIHIIELIFFVTPAMYLIRVPIRRLFEGEKRGGKGAGLES